MPIYTATYIEYHQVSSIHTDQFNTSDKDKWEWLKSAVESEMDAVEFDELPVKPPKDPLVWFALYEHLSRSDYEDKDEDWVTHRKGGFDTARTLLDAKGKVLESE